MKKLITATAFMIFGTMFITAQTTQTTQKSDKKVRMAEKPATSTEMKMDTSVKPNGMNRTVDTANLQKRQKEADGKIIKPDGPHGDGLTDEATKPSQINPRPGQTE